MFSKAILARMFGGEDLSARFTLHFGEFREIQSAQLSVKYYPLYVVTAKKILV